MDSTRRKPSLPRREFLHLISRLGGAAGASLVVSACRRLGIESPATTPTPAEPGAATTAAPATTQPTPAVSLQPATTSQSEMPAVPSQQPSKQPVSGSQVGKVALIVGNDRKNLIPAIIDLFGFGLQPGLDVFIKPNFNSADPFPGSTHIDTLRALVLKLKDLGAGPLTVGDRSGMAATRLVMESLGVFRLVEGARF